VRDRDTRLQDLFLTPKSDGPAQLQSIKDESARYNIGPFERNINVPLYPLKILTPAHRGDFSFSVDRASETAGVKTWRLTYYEHGRPTIVHDRDGQDIPLKGYFLLEQATGAIVESGVSVERFDYGVTIVVRFARDPKLGMWLPAEMRETYSVPLMVGTMGVERGTILSGTARYSNFRRFQVTTDTQIVPKK
jgi:YD repeat-containing protein